MEFKEWPKMPRLSRDIIITEKIDGTNSSIFIQDETLETDASSEVVAKFNGFTMRTGSRTRWITPKEDNFGFSKWAVDNAHSLFGLGTGHHFGEWWGSGIQRGYGLAKGEKRFSLFNTYKWSDDVERPQCCSIVPVLWTGAFDTERINETLKLLSHNGSFVAPGFMKPEGIIVWHTAGNFGFKKTIEKDETPKSLAK